MADTGTTGGRIEELVADVRDAARARGAVVAVAESLTGGAIAQALARGEEAGEWFAGGVVAYTSATKFRVLGVPEGPVVTREAARAMALGVLALTGADAAVAVTGVGGPGEEEGRPAGTVFLCAATPERSLDVAHDFDGQPEDVVRLTIESALGHLAAVLRERGPSRP